jgi:hypothetical protein
MNRTFILAHGALAGEKTEKVHFAGYFSAEGCPRVPEHVSRYMMDSSKRSCPK